MLRRVNLRLKKAAGSVGRWLSLITRFLVRRGSMDIIHIVKNYTPDIKTIGTLMTYGGLGAIFWLLLGPYFLKLWRWLQ